MAEGATVLGGALACGVLAHVSVPSVADINVREVTSALFLVRQLLLVVLDVLFVVVAGKRIRFLPGQGGLRPGAEESLPGVFQVTTREERFTVSPLGRVLREHVIDKLCEEDSRLLDPLKILLAELVVYQEVFQSREGEIPRGYKGGGCGEGSQG
jgi:hypothetical protein